MKKLFALSLILLAACSSPEQKKPLTLSLAANQKDSTAIIGTDTIHFTGTPRTVYDYVASSVNHKAIDTTVVVPPVSPVQSFAFQMQDITAVDYARPGAGVNQFFSGNGQQTPLPFAYADNDYRFDWVTLQTAASSYNFSALDAQINAMIKVGGKLSFRVVMFDPSRNTCPSFIPMLGGNEPDFNNTTYINAVVAFIKATSDHLNNTNSVVSGIKLISGVYKMDIPGIGKWGEMHFDGVTTGIQTLATAKPIVDACTTYFPNTWLMITISGLTNNSKLGSDLANYLLNAKNNLGLVGIRCDHLGWLDTFNGFDMKANAYYSNTALSSVLNRWKTSPVAGELMNSLSGINSASPYSDLPNEFNQIHASQFSNSNYCRNTGSGATTAQITSSDNNIIAASKLAGARIGFASATIKNGALTLNWSNTGNAPVYDNWDVYLICGSQQIKSSATIKGMQPGSQTSIDQLPPGNYSLSVIIKDPTGYRSAYPLLNKNRLSDGSYKIGDVKL